MPSTLSSYPELGKPEGVQLTEANVCSRCSGSSYSFTVEFYLAAADVAISSKATS